MAYTTTDRRSEQNVKQDDMLASKRFVIERKPDTSYFYELEEAVVLDVVLDENNPIMKDSMLDAETWPPNIDGSEPSALEKDYSWIGRIRFRFLNSQINEEKNVLDWAYPIENTGLVEYPLMNEIVIVGKYMGKYFYSRKLNTNRTVNSNALFYAERTAGQVERNVDVSKGEDGKYSGPESKMNFYGGNDYTGVLGSYFKFNPKIRTLKSYEGDTIIQSRFGSSIRFGAYDSNRENDNGTGEYSDQGGNPMILIRNRQATIKLPQGNTGKGYTVEDINADGSSIHLTSGKTLSKFTPTTATPIVSGVWQVDLPKFDGEQILINSDRLVLSSKLNEMLFFSKKNIGMVSDDEISITSNKKMTLFSMKSVTLGSRKIYLGDHGKPYEPALLGRSTVAWMYALCDWMLLGVNNQIEILSTLITFAGTHTHLGNLGKPTSQSVLSVPPSAVQIALWTKQLESLQASQLSLVALRSQLSTLMSSRVFVSGGVD